MSQPIEERLFSGYAGRLLLTASLGWAMIQTGRLVLSPMLTDIMGELQITEFQAGVALTTMWGLYALGQYPSGRLSDALSRKTLLVSGLTLLAVGFGLLAVAPTYVAFLVGAACVGVGAGLYPTAARALVSDLFVERRGEAFGLHGALGDAGGALAAGLAVGALALATWRAAFLPVVLVLVAVLAMLHGWSREAYAFRSVDLDVGETARRLSADRRLVALLGAYAMYAFTWQSAVGFLPSFLRSTKDFSPVVASGGFAVLFVVGAVVKPLAGGLGDRVSRPTVAAGTLVVAVGALSLVLVATSVPAVVAGVMVFAVGLMAFPPVMQSHLMDVFPDASMGGDLGAMRTVYIGLGSIGPTYVGFVAERSGYELAFYGLLVCLLTASAILLGLVATRNR